jgi:creatinine amidohydrolase
MRRLIGGVAVAVVLVGLIARAQQSKAPAGVALSDLSWVEAEAVLTPTSVVVIPLGLAAVERGPHLKLNNNERLARYLTSRVQAASAVVVAPTLTYHYSPSFIEYPGSTSLSQRTASDMTAEIVRSLARYGPRRFYVLNTSVSTLEPLRAASEALAADGLLLRYTTIDAQLSSAAVDRRQPPVGLAHADEVETSMMLFVDPSAVDMKKAVREYGQGFGPMTRRKGGPGVFSESGILGDPTLATREKGRVLVEAVVRGVLADIESLRTAALPSATARPQRPASVPGPGARGSNAEAVQPNGCTEGDERTIRAIGARFSGLWQQLDAPGIALLFSEHGDIRHPDGTIERGRYVILVNRQELFTRREYRGSVHPVSLNDIRCLGPNYALADGKWELRLVNGGVTASTGRGPATGPSYSGWCTLILTGAHGTWSIEAWRYTIDPPKGTPPPSTLRQPGFIGREQER